LFFVDGRLMLEKNGATVDVDKKAAVLLSAAELEEKPFRHEEVARQKRENEVGRARAEAAGDDGRVYTGMTKDKKGDKDREKNKDRERDKDRERNRDRSRSRNRSRSRSRDRDRSRSRDRGSKKRKDGRGGARDEEEDRTDKKKARSSRHDAPPATAPAPLAWLRTGIRVRIVSNKATESSRHYLQKASVVDVYQGSSQRIGTLRIESDGAIVENVKEKYLETVLPSVGELCMILTGEYQGQVASLLEKRKESDSAVVQLQEDMSEIVTLPMDNIAAIAK
jgi:G patch domain and KOW motifs-containing protein